MSRRAAAVAALVALAGCAASPPRPSLAPDPRARAALLAMDRWQAHGRVAVRAGSEGFGARFDWREAAEGGVLDVAGPFGAGAARIERSDARIRIESGGAAPLEVTAPFVELEPALAARIGFALPVGALRFWVRGVADPARPSEARPAGFLQDGWVVTVAAYVAVPGAPAPLPARLTLEREATRIRVVVDRWQVAPP